MSNERHIPEPGELVYQPRPSWAPAIFALGLALTLCGAFITFMLPGWLYAVIGAIIALFALRAMARDSVRAYYRLPRKQRVRGAVLPVEKISPPAP